MSRITKELTHLESVGLIKLAQTHPELEYLFRHALIQEAAYNSLLFEDRKKLHRQVGEAIEETYPNRLEELASTLADHFVKAEAVEKAIHYLLLAGDQARGLYAHQEAIEHYQQALELLKEQEDYERAARTLMKLGLASHNAFDFKQSRQAYEAGFALWQKAGEKQPTAAPPPAPHALKLNWGGPLTLDPTITTDWPSAAIIDQLFSGLVEQRPEMEVVPDVARSWEISESGRRYVFHLHDNMHWSDGVPLTAEDFEYAWKRVLDPASPPSIASLLYDVRGARAFHQGEVSDPERVGVRALDEVTLVVELEGPINYFPQLLTQSASYPVPRHIVEAYGNTWTEVGRTVTNGPFKLESWRPGQSVVLVCNPEYRGRFIGNVQQVELHLGMQPSAELEKYQIDRLDILNLWLRPGPEIGHIRHQYADDYLSGPDFDTLYIGFDVSRPPFDDLRVRRAFVLAIDRETLADVVMGGYLFPAIGGFIPPGMPGHSAEIGLPHDPGRARQLLTEAGYLKGRGFPIIDWLTTPGTEPVIEYLQTQLHENLGIELTWEMMEEAMFYDKLDKAPPHLFIIGWTADYPDPDNFLRVCPIRRNARWRNETYDRLVREARRVSDQGKRMRLYQQADRILIEEAVIIPCLYRRTHMLVKPWVSRFPTSPTKPFFFKDVIIEPH